jgi:hypothetical protein
MSCDFRCQSMARRALTAVDLERSNSPKVVAEEPSLAAPARHHHLHGVATR